MALLQRGEVSLTRWLPYVPCRGVQVQSKQRRLSRWLYNRRLNVHRLYKSLIQSALADWAEDRLSLSLDTSLFWDEYWVVHNLAGQIKISPKQRSTAVRSLGAPDYSLVCTK